MKTLHHQGGRDRDNQGAAGAGGDAEPGLHEALVKLQLLWLGRLGGGLGGTLGGLLGRGPGGEVLVSAKEAVGWAGVLLGPDPVDSQTLIGVVVGRVLSGGCPGHAEDCSCAEKHGLLPGPAPLKWPAQCHRKSIARLFPGAPLGSVTACMGCHAAQNIHATLLMGDLDGLFLPCPFGTRPNHA